jgi:hypothetical protein
MGMRPVPEVDEYLIPATVMLRGLGAHAGLPGFAERLVIALRAALLALNDVAPTDTMWLGTNRRPTLSKLQDYCLRRFREDRTDDLARWGLVALKCHFCRDDCGLALLTPLIASGPRAAVDAVSAAIWSYTQSDDLTDKLRVSLGRADRAGIERLARNAAGDEVTQVARIALQVMDGGRLSRPDGAVDP